ncbi:MAG: hypothetical protein WDW36_003541 [Sanguina aurantia]
MPPGVDVDLVLVDYSPNLDPGAEILNPRAEHMVYERLVRRLLTWKGRPAVLLVQMLWPYNVGWMGDRKIEFIHTTEDAMGVLAQYYGMPTISMRNALWLKQRQAEPGFGLEMRMADQWHLNELGHLYLADMLAWLVKHGLEQLCMRALTSSSSRPDRTELLPTPALPTSLLEPSSAPEGPSATSSKYKMCLMASGLEPYVGSRDQAWNYHSDDRHHRKFGYISTTNGSQLQLSIPNPASSSAPLVVFLSFLRSYDDMARADVVCSGGCSCVQTSLQGSWKIHASVTQLQPIEITKFNLGANCTIGLLHRGGGGGPPPSSSCRG